jgi:ribosomal protein S18 acetylase RimI-like enzyme
MRASAGFRHARIRRPPARRGLDKEPIMTAIQHLAAPSAEVRKAGPSDVPQISRALGRAFADDPVFSWVFPDPVRRHQILPAVFGVFTNAVRHHDAMYLAREGIGAALWVPAGVPAIADEDAETFGAIMDEVCGPDAGRMAEISAAIDAQHPHEPHEYLWFLGVQPAWQGHGIGSAMWRPSSRAATRPVRTRISRRRRWTTLGSTSVTGSTSSGRSTRTAAHRCTR